MKNRPVEHPVRVGMVSLGCAKNLVDAEIMLGTLLKDGMEITNNPAQADVLIVNTCSFIDSAQEESVDAILESDAVREAANRGQGLVVAGCLPQRFRDELPKLLPEVDAFMGVDQVAQVTGIVRSALARRAERLNTPSRKERKGKGTVMAALAQDKGATDAVAGHGPTVNVSGRPTFIPDFATPRFR
ncbi:MAG TPA: 30S ribosomal protein S12 methylthiotransferase RimO, partial [Verrucomicrobiota bacterium]|nr:30S ribosomal protein S12 methylthiotransferase RimO [Verrucomicrobiota bacterium]